MHFEKNPQEKMKFYLIEGCLKLLIPCLQREMYSSGGVEGKGNLYER